MILVGLTGTHGAGKGTVTDYLVREHGFTYISVSEFLAAEAKRRGRNADRIARKDIANDLRAQGATALMEAVFASIPPDTERAILEPQYTTDEVAFIHGRGGVVLSIDADLRVRYERVHARGSEKDNVTFEMFKAEQERELNSDDANKQNMAAAMAQADIHLTNNGTVEEFEEQIKQKLKAEQLI